MHALHCVNEIRKALHRDFYPEDNLHGDAHTGKSASTSTPCLGHPCQSTESHTNTPFSGIAHCMNVVRQALMCWGSTAVIPLKHFPNYGGMYVATDQVHTCREFGHIHAYTLERHNGSLQVPRPSQRRT